MEEKEWPQAPGRVQSDPESGPVRRGGRDRESQGSAGKQKDRKSKWLEGQLGEGQPSPWVEV